MDGTGKNPAGSGKGAVDFFPLSPDDGAHLSSSRKPAWEKCTWKERRRSVDDGG